MEIETIKAKMATWKGVNKILYKKYFNMLPKDEEKTEIKLKPKKVEKKRNIIKKIIKKVKKKVNKKN